MTSIWAIVFGLAALLALAVVLQPVARLVRLPHTVLLALVGIGLGVLSRAIGIDADILAADHEGGHGIPIWEQAIAALTGLNMTADVVLFVFLPALVFESALSIDIRKLRSDLPAILFLAIIGVVLSAVISGVALASYSGAVLVACVLIGAIISATDPVAVIALFKDLGAPKRLTILVEGESLLNDATAIVAATILLTLLTQAGDLDAVGAGIDFLIVFGGGIVVGAVVARGWIALMRPFRDHAISVVSLSLVLPFVTFVVAEHFLHVSGVMAAVVAGLALGSHGRKVIPPQIFTEIEHSWHQLAFWATALIFILVGLAVPAILGENPFGYLDEAAILFVGASIARATIIFVFMPLLARFGLIDPVSRAFQVIMVWGGLRGAVSLALALIVLDYPGINPDTAHFTAVLVTFFVFATLLLQATTISPMMKLLGLGKLSDYNQVLKERSVAWARASVRDELAHVLSADDTGQDAVSGVLAQYDVVDDGSAANAAEILSTPNWVRTGLNLALGQERQFYLEAYGDGAVPGHRLRELLARIEETTEAVRLAPIDDEAPLESLRMALRRFSDHSSTLRRAASIQRRTGLTGPLAEAIAMRFGIFSAARSALKRQEAEGFGDIAALLPPDASEFFMELWTYRRNIIERAHKALWLQYPDFAAAVDRRDVARTGFRLEQQAYDRLRDNGLIGPEVYGALHASLERQRMKLPPPRLDLRYDPLEMVAQVPLFAGIGDSEKRKIAKTLRPVTFAPAERIIAAGDPGDSMFFIANGVVVIHVPDGATVALGTGEFFGELALINDAPRTADVVSEGFSTLLKLPKREFERLMARNPGLARAIRSEADRRAVENA